MGEGTVGAGHDETLPPSVRAEVAARWQTAIRADSLVPLSAPALLEVLDMILTRIGAALASEPVDRPAAREAGAELAGLGYIRGESFGEILETLAELAPDTVPGPALRAVFGELTRGFISASQAAAGAHRKALQRAADGVREELENALERSEARYQSVVAQVREGIALVDPRSGRIVEANGALHQMLGYGQAELDGLPLYDIVGHDPSSVRANLRRAAHKRSLQVERRDFRRKDGTAVAVEGASTLVETDRRNLLCVVVRDISARRQVEADLAAARRALANGREEERARLAREIHDGAIQELSALRYRLVRARRCAAAGGDDTASEIREVEQRIATVIGQLRTHLAELRPPCLDEGGLRAALTEEVDRIGEERDLRIQLDMAPNIECWPRPVSLCLFRVAQEAIRNAVTHGRARCVAVQAREVYGGAFLRVSDDGTGFAVPSHLETLARGRHFGLIGVSERVTQTGGRLHVRSRPGRGAVVTAWVPLAIG